MTHTRHALLWMSLYLLIVLLVAGFLHAPLQQAFEANSVFNGLILAVLLVGIVINYLQVLRLNPELDWIRKFRTGQTGRSLADPVLLKSLAKELSGTDRSQFRLSTLSLRTLLDGIRARLDESREISRYLIGLLVFLGLLGTFWGLLGTIGAVASVIDALDVGEKDFAKVFADLKSGLQAPLAGMGTAFSSSLLGLGGSLVLGFLDILAGQAQNRFFNHLEEWLSSATNLVDTQSVGGAEQQTQQAILQELKAQRLSLERLLTQDKGQTH